MKVSRFIALAAVFFIITSAMAQEAKTEVNQAKKDNPPKTLFDTTDASYSGYLGIYTSYTKIGDADSCLAGGRGGLIINDSVVLGLAGAGLVYPTKREKLSGSDYTGELDRTNFGYGGFLAEYYFNPKELLSFQSAQS
ncbi:MAG: hypothetical protein MZV70_77445 [Desulfobacterales bacterium]|nr:hypothetical protein [Desulfobacterales bacterium]